MHAPIKYVEKGLSIAANGAWVVFNTLNKLNQRPSFTPKWSDKPLLKSYEKTKPPLGWPRETDSLCPTCTREARQEILDDIAAGAEQRLGGDDVIADFHLSEERERDGRHPGCGCARGFGAFEGRHAGLEHRDRRVRKARILIAGVFALEARLGLGRRVVDVALGQEQRLGGLGEARPVQATTDADGVEAEPGRRVTGLAHDCLQGSPATFQPDVRPRWPSSSGGPSKPSSTL